jgi:ABC-2 type transport system permease protein
MTESQGELYDIGYQRYEGPREGRMRARKAVWVNGLRIVLGLGRPFLAKLFPWMFLAFAVVFALTITIIVSLGGDPAKVPGASDYYQIISFFLILFAAIAAPELLCPDRRDGVISLYLVRPLTTVDYISARWLAFFSVTLVVLYLGQVVLLAGSTLAADRPLDYLRENWLDIPRFLGAGVVFAAFTTTISLAAAAFTTRRAYAAAFVVAVFIISSAAASALTDCDDHSRETQAHGLSTVAPCKPLTGDAAKWFNLVGIGQAPIHMNDLIFDKENAGLGLGLTRELPDVVPITWYLLLVLVPGLALWWRYQRLSV